MVNSIYLLWLDSANTSRSVMSASQGVFGGRHDSRLDGLSSTTKQDDVSPGLDKAKKSD